MEIRNYQTNSQPHFGTLFIKEGAIKKLANTVSSEKLSKILDIQKEALTTPGFVKVDYNQEADYFIATVNEKSDLTSTLARDKFNQITDWFINLVQKAKFEEIQKSFEKSCIELNREGLSIFKSRS